MCAQGEIESPKQTWKSVSTHLVPKERAMEVNRHMMKKDTNSVQRNQSLSMKGDKCHDNTTAQ